MGDLAMIKINLVCVGTLKENYWKEALDEYKKRLSRYVSFSVIELKEKRTKEEEGKEILARSKGYIVAFDLGGKELSSEEIAAFIDKKATEGTSEMTFLIGGSEGLSDEVKKAVDFRLSFGKVTYPHQLMRVIAAEQLYRAMTILNGVTYHK